MPRLVGTATRYACNCVVTDTGWLPRDSESNGNTRDLDPGKLKTAINRAGGPQDTDENARVVEKLKEARAKGKRGADLDKMEAKRVKERDPETGKLVDVWTAPPGRCELHDAPVVLSSTWDYDAPEPDPEDAVIGAQPGGGRGRP